MIRILGLLEKEIRQNAGTLGFIVAVGAAAVYAVLSGNSLGRMMGSGLRLAAMVIFVFLPLCGYVLAGSMVGGEFRHRTQLFLEGLPLPRWQMITVKYLLGLSGMILVTGFIITAAWWDGRNAERMTPNFVALLAVKAGTWSAFAWSLNFAFAFLGRYRMPSLVAILLGLILLKLQGVLVEEWWPFAIMNNRFAYERYVWPMTELVGTGVMTLLLTTFAFYLGCMRDASVAAMLAEKMSPRERMVVTLLGIAGIFLFSQISSTRKHTQPVHLPGSMDYESGPVRVQVAAAVDTLTPEETAALKQWSQEIGIWLNETAKWLGRETMPPLYIVHRRDYVAKRLEWEKLDSRQGGLARLNLTLTSIHDLEIREKLLHEVLDIAHHFRIRRQGDTRGWVLDGFSRWWVRKDSTEPITLTLPPPPSPDELSKWMKLREQKGSANASRIAEVGVHLLAKKTPAGCQAFIASILGKEIPHHTGAVVIEAWNSVPSLLQNETGIDWHSFAQEWSQQLIKTTPSQP